MKMRLVLPFGFVADVDVDDTDRPRFIPPLLDRADHADDCRCEACVLVRQAASRIRGTHP